MPDLFPARAGRLHAACATALLAIGVAAGFALPARADDAPATFSKPVIDIGIVVANLDQSARFYTNAIGFREIPGFKVPAERATDIGLTANQPATIRVFVLGEGNQATRVKLMSFPQAPGVKPDKRTIHATLGMNYLTLYVTDILAAQQRLLQAGAKTLGKTPLDLGGGTWIAVVQDPDGNFIELIGPAKPVSK